MDVLQRLLHTFFYLTIAGYAMLALFLVASAFASVAVGAR
jgi:hypothetical protein